MGSNNCNSSLHSGWFTKVQKHAYVYMNGPLVEYDGKLRCIFICMWVGYKSPKTCLRVHEYDKAKLLLEAMFFIIIFTYLK